MTTPTPLRAVYATTDPLAFTGDQIVYLDTTEPGPCKRPGIRMLPQEPRMTTANHVDWLEEHIAAETTPRTRVSVPRRSSPDLWGIVALACGAVTVIALLTLAVLAVGRR